MSDEEQRQQGLKELVDAISEQQWNLLRSRFGIEPGSATDEEIVLKLHELTKIKLREFEEKAQKKRDRENGSDRDDEA